MVLIFCWFKMEHTSHVALAGQTGGAVRAVLDFFCFFFVSRQKRK